MPQDNLEMLGLCSGQTFFFFFTLICDLVLGLFFLSRPGIFMKSSSDLMPVLNKKKELFTDKPFYEGRARLREYGALKTAGPSVWPREKKVE